MNWFLIVISAYLLFAVALAIDKYILSKTAFSPASAAFLVGLLGLFVLFLIPFQFFVPPRLELMVCLLGGIFFTWAVFLFYQAVSKGEISRVAPLTGSLVPIFTFILAYLFLGDRLTYGQLLAFCLLVAGGILIIWPGGSLRNVFNRRLLVILASAFLFAGSFTATKFAFNTQPFLNSFIWIRIGGFLGACLLLVRPADRAVILAVRKRARSRTIGLFALNKVIAASAAILQNYAIFLGSVILVNALQGVQYVFLLGLALVLSWKFPYILKEQMNRGLITQKITALLLVGLGLGILGYGF